MKRIVQYIPSDSDQVFVGRSALLCCVIDHPNVEPNGTAYTSPVEKVWTNAHGKLDVETENTIFHAVMQQ